LRDRNWKSGRGPKPARIVKSDPQSGHQAQAGAEQARAAIPLRGTDAKRRSGVAELHLLANFTHQVINPLSGVIGTLDNVIDGTVTGPRRDQRLKAVRAQLEWVVLLIRNLAYFTSASLDAGSSAEIADARTCVIPKLVIEAALFFQEVGESRGVEIYLEDRKTQYTVGGSPDLLRQVFMNLFDNAIKYADSDTRVIIRPWAQKRTGALIVEVENTGVGFEPTEADRLFEVGYRGPEAKRRLASGTGLGLYICRRIIEDVHHGTIEAEHARASHKTVVRLRFPKWNMA
jgi:signal transduction histidine kinase